MKVTAYVRAKVQVDIPDKFQILDQHDDDIPWDILDSRICDYCLSTTEEIVCGCLSTLELDDVEVELVEGEHTVMAEL